jgi:hypothetical protein
MPLNQNDRILALQKLIAESKPDREDDIVYKNDKKRKGIYQIPFDFLVFNKYNGRILSMTKSFESQFYELNPAKEADSKIISDFLYESKEDRNKATELDLQRWGQKRYGIVTKDGVIVDGNRRASLLKRNYAKDPTKSQPYFLAVILDDVLDGVNSRDIMQLETTYQMGEDEKLDYNPIEKYLKCRQLREADFTSSDIAKMMVEKESKVNEWLDILKLMDEYLNSLGYNNIYTRLEKREGQFVDLNSYLNKYRSGTGLVEWNYDKESDVSDLKMVCFDYIRAQYEGKEFRSIAKPGKESFFCKENVWKKFFDEHNELINPLNQSEKTRDEIQEENPDVSLPKLLKQRDEIWATKAKGLMQGNLNKSIRVLEDANESNAPLKLISRAIGTLEQVNTENPAFYDDTSIDDLLKKINEIIWDFKQTIKIKRK